MGANANGDGVADGDRPVNEVVENGVKGIVDSSGNLIRMSHLQPQSSGIIEIYIEKISCVLD